LDLSTAIKLGYKVLQQI